MGDGDCRVRDGDRVERDRDLDTLTNVIDSSFSSEVLTTVVADVVDGLVAVAGWFSTTGCSTVVVEVVEVVAVAG